MTNPHWQKAHLTFTCFSPAGSGSIIVTDERHLSQLAAFFPENQLHLESKYASGGMTAVEINAEKADGTALKITVQPGGWSVGNGDWPFKDNALIDFLETLRK